jgi:hypothetical protein
VTRDEDQQGWRQDIERNLRRASLFQLEAAAISLATAALGVSQNLTTLPRTVDQLSHFAVEPVDLSSLDTTIERLAAALQAVTTLRRTDTVEATIRQALRQVQATRAVLQGNSRAGGLVINATSRFEAGQRRGGPLDDGRSDSHGR